MKVEGARPANFSGVPLILSGLSFVLIIGIPRIAQDRWYLSIVGWLLLGASWGTSVEVEDGTLKLRYAFDRLTINVPLSGIEDVKVVSRLERAVLVREFPGLYLLIFGIVLFAFADLLLLPSGLLEGFYFGDIGLMFFGLLYLGVMSLPFGRIYVVGLFGVIALALAGLLMKLKTGFVTPAFIVILAVVALIFIADYYSRDYVVIKSQKGKYLIMAEKPEMALQALLRRAANDQAP
jgi:hypothetical protein